MKLKGKTVVVTGAGRGIGKTLAVAFAREGANVCVASRSSDEIESVAAEIRELGRQSLAVQCDVCESHSCESLIEAALSSFGTLDILVNNAGGNFVRGPIADSDPRVWQNVIESNLLGTYYCSRAAIPAMIAAGGGKIINIGSGMGHSARPNNAAYNTAKAGVWMFTQCLAMEVWQHGIDVNELIPGPVYTRLTEDFFPAPGTEAPPIAASERVKKPEDCIPLAMFLATHPPGGPTGQSFSLARRPV